MKKILWALLLAFLLPSASHAGDAKVTWHEPDKFTDIRPINETLGGFQKRVIEELDQVFADLAKELPNGYHWNVTVTDLDLAGDIRPRRSGTGEEIRVVKDVYWPRMSFNFDLKNPQGQTVASGNEDIADMNFLSHANPPNGHTSFPYERQMLRDWFYKQQNQKVFPTR